ncbi:hypothetical protein QL285_019810 [Trifolium repens]|nr:hypothetical protein QL285_019810 [Trifolium repens]
MGGSKCSSYANSSGGGNNFNLPRCGCNTPMKLLISNTGLNPKRKFWKCRNGLDGCDNLVWDDELDEVEAANPKSRSAITSCKNCERMKEFGTEFGRELGRQIGKEIGKKFSQFVIGVIMVFVVLFAMILKSM